MNENFSLALGPLVLSESILLSVLVSALIAFTGWLATRKGPDSALHTALQAAMQLVEQAVADVLPKQNVRMVFPFVATLWLYLLCANLVGLIPGLSSPTRDLSITSALAITVFVAVHVYGIRAAGWKNYLRHYLKPSPILLPFHLISELTRTLALAIRLFGNMMSLEMAALLVLIVAGFLVPVPLLVLHVVEALVQAYIFGMLALIYISTALDAQEKD
ncbi:MAG: F0F1 ATP synthase subunit A [Gammaproteobacteria bacterium]|nr:F0F1 ATP synthase subunit A [Gammaproteobacteria bacterium]